MTPLTLSIRQVTEATGLPKSTVSFLARSGQLTYTQVGRRKLIPYDALQVYLKRHTVKATHN